MTRDVGCKHQRSARQGDRETLASVACEQSAPHHDSNSQCSRTHRTDRPFDGSEATDGTNGLRLPGLDLRIAFAAERIVVVGRGKRPKGTVYFSGVHVSFCASRMLSERSIQEPAGFVVSYASLGGWEDGFFPKRGALPWNGTSTSFKSDSLPCSWKRPKSRWRWIAPGDHSRSASLLGHRITPP